MRGRGPHRNLCVQGTSQALVLAPQLPLCHLECWSVSHDLLAARTWSLATQKPGRASHTHPHLF